MVHILFLGIYIQILMSVFHSCWPCDRCSLCTERLLAMVLLVRRLYGSPCCLGCCCLHTIAPTGDSFIASWLEEAPTARSAGRWDNHR